MDKRLYNLSAVLFLGIFFLLSFSGLRFTSLTSKEATQIVSGYSYLKLHDYRLDITQPPLGKDLAAIGVLNANFPYQNTAWQSEKPISSEELREIGDQFLYQSGNNPESLVNAARLPFIFLAVFLGLAIYIFISRNFGYKIALLALFFYCFDPNILAHSRLASGDIAASFGALLSVALWLRFLKNPDKLNTLWAGFGLALALCCNFFLIILIPYFLFLLWFYAKISKKSFSFYFPKALLAFACCLFLFILPCYYFHSYNMPLDRLALSAPNILGAQNIWQNDFLSILSQNRFLKPLGIFSAGLFSFWSTPLREPAYFLGIMSTQGWWYYFPAIYALKFPLPLHIFSLLSILCWLFFTKKENDKKFATKNFTACALAMFIVFYWLFSLFPIQSGGIRHLLPVLPFTYALLALGVEKYFLEPATKLAKTRTMLKIFALFLFLWQIGSCLAAYPDFLSYFNEAILGGKNNGYLYAVNSDFDWGQDFWQLEKFVRKNKIENIKVDYFGGVAPGYYLGSKYQKIDAQNGKQSGWIAISATSLQLSLRTGGYQWLSKYSPYGRAGRSIFIYYIPE